METAKRLYFENISDTVVPALLVKTIQSIVIDKKVDSEYLVFAIKFAIATKIPIKHPFGLHYLVDNYKVKQAWKARKVKEEQKKLQSEPEKTKENKDVNFTFANTKKEGFESIFGGD